MTGSARILIVDDEPSILKAMAPLLRSRGYDVETAATGRTALETFDRDPPDLVILDLMLPDLDGLDVCRRLRERGRTPIIVLSAREAERDKVAALDLGADDYVTKPFGPDELLARVRVALRRTTGDPEPAGQLTRGDLVVDFDKRRVVRNGDEIRLTPKEFELLVYLVRNAGRVLTHRALLREIWGPHVVDQPEHLRVLVNAVRKKVEPDPAHPRYILTEPWVGYRFAEDPE
ncbi:MAG TPA: response regulator transcription factor [Vicinamibacterales bacterium]|nr:response regulator transcription factor [Vicinamibacterales bacterium]